VLSKIAAELEKGEFLILLHGNADPDALASAFAISSTYRGATIGVPGGLDRVSKVVASTLGIETVEKVDLSVGKFLILDTSGPEQLNVVLDLSSAMVIDHHAKNAKWEKAKLYHCDDAKSSCSEIIYEFLKASRKNIPKNVALALMFGMLTDSGYFKFAKPSTLMTFSELMSLNNIQMDEVMSLADLETDISERISQLKGAQRLKYWKVGDHIVASSQGSAFEASVCKSLISLGADVAFVGSQRGEQFRISSRATQAVVREGLHLGRLLGTIGSETTNGGGGHPGAAGITGVGDVEAILNICVDNAIKVLNKISSSN
jgi:phosphoesterase RecJ-like protein